MSDVAIGSNDFKALLALQDLDTKVDQLEHRRSHLPTMERLLDVQQRAVDLRPQLASVMATRDEYSARQSRLEAEVQSIEGRIAELNSRLYGGTNVSPRDAQAMAQEVKQLTGRRSDLEDAELEVMELLEPVNQQVAELERKAKGLARDLQEAQDELVANQNEIDVELAQVRTARVVAESDVAAPLIVAYDKLRPKLGGIAVAPLVGTSCGGCHLVLSSSEIDRIRKAPDSQIMNCEECGRILVR